MDSHGITKTKIRRESLELSIGIDIFLVGMFSEEIPRRYRDNKKYPKNTIFLMKKRKGASSYKNTYKTHHLREYSQDITDNKNTTED